MAATEDLKTILGRGRLAVARNYQRKQNMGYMVDGTQCKGITRRLKEVFYGGNFKEFGRRRLKGGSSREAGEAFHRHVYHRYLCLPRKMCGCAARFGKATGAPRKGTDLSMRLALFHKYLKEKGWKVYDCEMIVGCQDKHYATSIDMVCVDNLENPTRVILVELKTGYTVDLKKKRTTTPGSENMTGIAGSRIPNTFNNHHQLQLWFCAEAFQRSHGIFPHDAVIVYVNPGKPVKEEYAAGWWFRNPKMRDLLFAQLNGQK